jgi:hypothetical protein
MKGIQQILGLRNLKSVHSVGIRSIPKAQRSSYLELYVLRREKDRLEKEILALTKRKAAADQNLGSIIKQIERLQSEAHEGQKTKGPRGAPMRHPKSMAINY